MQTDQQSSSASETNLQSEYIVSSDANSGVTASTSDPALLQQPAKRPTRQWAAWTREEEESFFTALRQVGKNFEKITCRVKSKNKDQVRHYYYRLVRRMNKLLGPTLCLDAKNSKDTNAAMLRWWSLLEKYSCKASKLHLKPRRFKVFVETLEHQLLKDRKKNVRKRPSQAENASPSTSTAANHSKPPGPDSHPVKMVLVDSQNIQKLGPGKPSFKRNIGIGTNRANCKGESTSVKQVRQRRKPGVATSTAYKKWEKAAIAGVSLVADAAEHVERTAADKDNANDQRQKFPDSVSGTLPPLPPLSQNHVSGSDLQTCSKLKLQLFPIDDSTRRALEMDNHNPHLELTLSTRKKISSVLEHLNRKWGSSSVASGELILFPYGVQREDMVGCRSWTQDSPANAADVYAIIGSPPVFRLRYGWFTNVEAAATPCFGPRDMMLDGPLANHQSAMVGDEHSAQPLSMSKVQDPLPVSTGVPGQMDGSAIRCPNSKFSKPSDDAGANISCYSKLGTDENMKLNDGDDLRSGNSIALSAGEWADSLTNVSVGDLLLEVACNEDVDYANSPVIKSPQRMQPFSVSCDSFDAAVAAHIFKYQNKMSFQSTLSPHISSIWDGEETCDAFSFQRSAAYKEAPRPPGNISTEAAEQIEQMSPSDSDGFLEVYEVETAAESPVRNDPVNDCLSDDQHILKNPEKDFSGLTDIYWPDSLGPLDLDVRSSNYHSEDLILSDSLSYLNRLIASSLDAFQSCSFFGLDKKEPEPKAESRENAPFRISSGV